MVTRHVGMKEAHKRNYGKKEKKMDERETSYEIAIEKIFNLHARALSCHCECLGMNAENCVAMCEDRKVPYNGEAYHATMQKWGLIDEKGNSTI